MPYSDIVNRTDAGAELAEQLGNELVNGIQRESVALALGRRVPTTTRDSRVPVLTSAPDAYWVAGDTGLKQTSKGVFTNQGLIAEELAVVVPIPDAVLDDSEYDLWSALRPNLVTAFARRLDAAVLFGIDAPASWPAGLSEVATTATATVVESADAVADLMLAAEKVGASGYNVTGAAVRPGWQYAAAAQRSESVTASPAGANSPFPLMVGGLGIHVDPPRWDSTIAEAIVADWSKVLIGIRQDFTTDIFNTGVITNDLGAIVLNLLQQDMSALRCVMRVGYLLAQPDTQSDVANPAPVAMVTPAP